MNKKLYVYINGLSDFGTRMDFIVLNALMFSMTQSTIWLSANLAARVVGGLLSSISSGVLADKMDRRKLMMIADILRAVVVVAAIPFPSPVMILVVSFLIGLVSSYFQVSFQSSIPQIFGEGNVLGVNSLIARLTAISTVAGFLGGGIISDMFGYKSVLVVDCISYSLSFLFLLGIRWNSKPNAQPQATEPKQGYFKNLAKDVREVSGYIWLRPAMFVASLIYFAEMLGASSHNLGFPILAADISFEQQATLLGMIWAFEGAGSVLMTFVLPKLKWVKKYMLIACLLAAVFQSGAFILALSTSTLWLVLLFAFIAGIFDASHGTLYMTMMQQSDNNIRGRIFGISSLANRLGFGIGFLVAPMLLSVLSLTHMVWVLHGLVVVSGVLAILWALKARGQAQNENATQSA